MVSNKKQELKVAVAITVVLTGFVYCSNMDYAEEMRSATDYCSNAESVGAVDTDEYKDKCL